MEIIRLTDSNIEEAALAAAEVLNNGGVVLYPTDTLYALGAEAFQTSGVDKIYAIKGRDAAKPIHAIVPSVETMEMFAEMPNEAHTLAKDFLPGPLTLILKKKPEFTSGIGRDIETIGFRIPNHPFCIALSQKFPHPITTTSANVAGLETMNTVGEILDQLGEAETDIDLVIDAGELPGSLPSTVVDLSEVGHAEGHPTINREGAIPAAEIWEAIGFEPGIVG